MLDECPNIAILTTASLDEVVQNSFAAKFAVTIYLRLSVFVCPALFLLLPRSALRSFAPLLIAYGPFRSLFYEFVRISAFALPIALGGIYGIEPSVLFRLLGYRR